MKIRMGFVSNSSSSSFIVAFPKRPESVEEVKEMMFGQDEEYFGQSTMEIAKSVFSDLPKTPTVDILSFIPEKAIFAIECGASVYDVMEKLEFDEEVLGWDVY